ncbi:MAG: DUF2959 domain-containing protein [Opitutaceae bacterium]|nr:DUF2959 domain-containing protein [Opitutaceae bacterium]
MNSIRLLFFTIGLSFVLAGCQSAYYGTMETLGVHKRDILVDRVEEAKESQEEAKEQFANALEEFMAVTEFEGSDLRDVYDKLASSLEESEAKATAVRVRIDSIESVAGYLFEEWEAELDEYSNESLRRSSQRQLSSTKTRYDRLITVMRRAESRMDPVLDAFRDQVLFLKHNLNAQALASLGETSMKLQDEIGELIAQMEKSISEANSFIESMRTAE